MTIIDAHCHAGLGDGFRGPWDTRAAISSYLARAEEAGINKTIVFAPFSKDYAAANRRTAHIVASHPDRLLGFACVHPDQDAGRVGNMVAEAMRLGLRGLKVHRFDSAVTREVGDAAQRFRLPVIFDVMGEPAPIDLLASEFPDVNWIVPHLGSFSDEWWAQRSVIELIVRHPNVYADTSAVRRFNLLEEAVDRAPEKVIFGSDGPELHPGVELAKIRALHPSPTVFRAIVGGTISRLVDNVTLGRQTIGQGRSARQGERV
jgi:uncharacterized protein